MDYTQNSQRPFFTPGVGNEPLTGNNFQAENNLDLTNGSTSWGNNPEQPQSSVNSINQVSQPNTIEATNLFPNNTPDSEMIAPNLPPNYQPEPTPDTKQNVDQTFDSGFIVTKGDHISKRAVKELKGLEGKFKNASEGSYNAATFYDDIRDAMEDNLENSYGRKLKS